MKERPILFNGPMVRALLDGSKTQTRRAVKGEMLSNLGDLPHVPDWIAEEAPRLCPYGQPGDHLWVRETAAEISCRLTYRADTDDGAHCVVKRWTPSIHMPREWSRILLEIVSVRVERLQDIGTEDIEAEGVVTSDEAIMDHGCRARVLGYQRLWESINGAGNWDANPWVWVVEFRRVEGGQNV
jgi:hypothetical protein